MKRTKNPEKSSADRESAVGLMKNEKTGLLLTDIVSRLDRIEEKIDENFSLPVNRKNTCCGW
jgi:hypothetical protein